MDKNPNDHPTVGGAPPNQMTWQQQMMTPSWNQAPRKKKEKNTEAPKKKEKTTAPAVEKVGSNMTWQQELFLQSKRVGPAFDHAADARDEQTFGGESALRPKSAPPGTTGTPERRKAGKSKGSNKNTRVPNTPQKKQGSAPVAYAGPTFHNSPSAASLPTPKFANRGARSPLSEPASAEPSTNMTPLHDSTVPSPPPLQTVDRLLAQMLKTSSVS